VWRCRESNPGPHGRTVQASTCIVSVLAFHVDLKPAHRARPTLRLIGFRRYVRSQRTHQLDPLVDVSWGPRAEAIMRQMGLYAAIAYE